MQKRSAQALPFRDVPVQDYGNKTGGVGQNLIHTVYIQSFWQGIHQIYGAYIQFWPTLEIGGFSARFQRDKQCRKAEHELFYH